MANPGQASTTRKSSLRHDSSTSTVSGVEGTGLGLSITKSIVDLMDGTIEVVTAPGSGTQIVFACGGGIYGSVAGAAKETGGGKLIGVDVDQKELIAQAAAWNDGNVEAYMDMTVTSAVKNHGATVALVLNAVFAGNFDAFGGKSERLGVISADPAENAVQLAASTQFGDGFTAEDYAALTAKLFNGELTVSDDVDKAPADFATVITVDDVGNVK